MRSNLKRSAALIIGSLGVTILFAFQNCSPVNFKVDENSSIHKTSFPGSAIVKAGDESTFPPLKMVFVVDNSGTMQINQINLSSSFAKLFDGTNASNLTPFESSAYVFNTAQKSINNDVSLFSKLPDRGPTNLNAYSYSALVGLRGTNLTQGKIPGDLVGYGVESVGPEGQKTLTYVPSPVIGFRNATQGVEI
ncbi:MAG: hypothetical protein V4692_07635, partial [Bdellovibrionota bacterium]